MSTHTCSSHRIEEVLTCWTYSHNINFCVLHVQIQALFIAPTNDLRHAFDYGYITHNGQRGLTKLDLDNMRYIKAVDLSAYDCVPRSLVFVPIGEW